ncbi:MULTISPECIES: peptide chain release factor N(5)-glutamine methyltransferase [unclassified Streptococcus]|uniref:peptide chain release factor N(5)-glutamine methyltransferase n=1 Tax=unclassified Streptococcus TaxID=2608887 RepID=UPI00025B2E2A|nr:MULTISPECIES: peptide chain release factor N(5)-glutamine methyltransferase [unclassified Streptococcus]EIF39051.1 protein-(glutamine-N5) methyltransferase, release factor-specific [Streptococcus sp. SK140]OFK86457.1 protein-(glutamine-N5) methyltransferase, release factor-specific [Streptococcus sp. HMSC056C01]
MKLAQIFKDFEEKLIVQGEEAESLSFVYRSLKNLSFTDFVFALQQEVTDEDYKIVEDIYKKLTNHIPAQYIIGHAEFFGMQLKVDERVLIPRPETEELVELVLAENPKENLKVLDIGTGSGAIALALAKNRPDWSVAAADISQDSLELATENANAQNLNLNLSFIKSDCFSEISSKYDIIVSNPPYISRADEVEVGLNVLHSEPHLALFADEDGLAIYRRIAEDSKDYLNDGGKIYLEIGYKQGQSVPALFMENLPEKRVRTLKDQFGQDRMVVIDDGEN